MARQLEYDAKVDPTVSAREELEALIETLHASGTLRVLNGFFGRFADVSEVAMEQLTTRTGQNALANAALLFMSFAKVHPDDLQAVLHGVERGAATAREVLRDEPPNMLRLLAAARAPETRRGLLAMVALLREVGRHVPAKLEEQEEEA